MLNIFYNIIYKIYSILQIYNMAFTRFHDDPYRIQKRIEETTFGCNYTINTPGPGLDLPFVEDTQIRMQKWGANLQTNTVNLESDLFGLTRTLNRDLVGFNDYRLNRADTNRINYPKTSPIVDESRSTHPAWMYRDLEQSRWENPILNPQNDIELKFNNNIQTRILEKDYHVPRIPIIEGSASQEYYLTGPTICSANSNETNCR
jgi:hypothetical protein